jgi:small subunit ribosomal protein S2
MKPYIFTERNNIHIIDLQQTLEALEEAYALVRDHVAEGGKMLFVGTKRQAQETIELEASRCGMPYVNSRWLGGTLTNWATIRSRIDELEGLEQRRDAGEFELLTKKEALTLTRRIEKLEERLGGIREMKSLPDMAFVVDVKREETAVHEANLMGMPVIALVDTNCDPGGVDYVIPSNDDAIRAIKLLTAQVADAVLEGIHMRKDKDDELPEEVSQRDDQAAAELTDEELLGEATLAKLQSGDFGVQEGEEAKEAAAGEAKAAEAGADEDEAPTAEAPEVEGEDTPEAEEQEAEGEAAPAAEAPEAEEPEAEGEEAPAAEAPEAEEPEAEGEAAPAAEAPEAEEPEAEGEAAPAAEAPEAEEPEAEGEQATADEVAETEAESDEEAPSTDTESEEETDEPESEKEDA